MAATRVYADAGAGKAKTTDLIITDDGAIVVSPTTPKTVTKQQVKRAGCQCVNYSTYNAMKNAAQKNTNDMTTSYTAAAAAHQPAITRQGYIDTVNAAPSRGSNGEQLTLSLTNTSTETQTIVFGDGSNQIARGLNGFDGTSGAVIVNGSYGETSLADFKEITGNTAVELTNYHFTGYDVAVSSAAVLDPNDSKADTPGTVSSVTPSGSVFNAGKIQEASGDLTGDQPVLNTLHLTMDVTDRSFQSHIRSNGNGTYVRIIDPLEGYVFVLPPLTRLDCAWDITRAARGHSMVTV